MTGDCGEPLIEKNRFKWCYTHERWFEGPV